MPQRKLPTNWISSYVAALSPISEAPEAYMVWSAISVVSAVLKKRVWMDRGIFTLYPNQYIVLVGPPGIGKGSAIHPAHAFIRGYPTKQLSNYLSDRITAEEIVRRLSVGFPTTSIIGGQLIAGTEATAVIIASELSTFLGSSDWMTGFLCDTWDRNDFEYGTKNKGSLVVKDMCVSLIGACVPDFIRKINGRTNAADAVNGGFTARAMFIFANEKSKSLAHPVSLANTQKGPEIITALRHDLEIIAQLKGEFKFNSDTHYLWDTYYKSIKIEETDSDAIRYFKGRQSNHVLKVAMCFSAASGDSLIIDRWSLTTAIALVDSVLSTLDKTFRGVGESSLSEATAKIQNYLERKGLTSRSELVRDNHRHATVEDIDRITKTLEMCSVIKTYTQGGKQWYQYITATLGAASNGNGNGHGTNGIGANGPMPGIKINFGSKP